MLSSHNFLDVPSATSFIGTKFLPSQNFLPNISYYLSFKTVLLAKYFNHQQTLTPILKKTKGSFLIQYLHFLYRGIKGTIGKQDGLFCTKIACAITSQKR